VQNTELKVLLGQALARIGELEARLGMTSNNSGKPPSSDGLAKPAPKSLRRKSSRGPGRPKGQPGVTLELVDVPDREIVHEPGPCLGCGGDLRDAAVVGVERRQVFDLPPVRIEVTEHRLVAKACLCGRVTKARAPDGVNAPVQYGSRLAGIGVYLFHGQFLSKSRTVQALSDVFGVMVAAATLVAWTGRIAAQISGTALVAVKYRIADAAVVHFDETGLRVAGRLHWMHSASTPTDVLLTVHRRRGTKAMDAAGILPAFTGTAVHDAWAPYDTYTRADHALCNAHAVRKLVYVVDTAPQDVAALAGHAATPQATATTGVGLPERRPAVRPQPRRRPVDHTHRTRITQRPDVLTRSTHRQVHEPVPVEVPLGLGDEELRASAETRNAAHSRAAIRSVRHAVTICVRRQRRGNAACPVRPNVVLVRSNLRPRGLPQL